ncbi:MAG TPA: lysophospholipid acyltransferase family protein [Bryobacteraceae bacterium]|nr:lysophospholipid acyltransferase family protein [Bryobacteraceae bacterium]
MAQNKSWLKIHAEYAIAATLMKALRRLPMRAANLVANNAARTLDLAVPKLRRVARTNLAFAFPELGARERDRIIDGVFENIARLLLTLARFPDLNSGNISDWISYEGLEHYSSAKQAGCGVLVLTGHLGNWELSAFAHAWMTEPMNVMVRPLDNPLIDALVEERRALSGNSLIYKQDAARSVIKALRMNQAVGILADQNTSLAEGMFVNFFGKAACTSSTFVRLAYHTGAPVIPGFALWDPATQHYILRFYRPIKLTGDEHADTQRIHSTIEGVIRAYPDQWMWIHRRWKTRPPGEAKLY